MLNPRKPHLASTPFYRLINFLWQVPVLAAYVLSPFLVALTTWAAVNLQDYVRYLENSPHPPSYVSFFYFAIVLITLVGGRGPGIVTVAFAELSTVIFLIKPKNRIEIEHPSDAIALTILLVVGTLMVLGMDALRKNARLLLVNSDLLAAEQARANQEALLNTIGQSVRSARDPEQIQAEAARALGELLEADSCCFLSFAAQQDLATVSQQWSRKDRTVFPERFRMSDIGLDLTEMRKTGASMIISDAIVDPGSDKSPRHTNAPDIRAAIFVPLVEDAEIEAMLAVVCAGVPRVWTDVEIALVEMVASQTRAAVDSVRLQRKEHNIAIQLQAALQPPLKVNVTGMSLATHYRAALEEANVGGDFYDVLALDHNRYAFVIGDVCGKGLTAASQVSALRNMLRCLLFTGQTSVEAMRQLNRVLLRQSLLTSFATMIVAVYEAGSGMLEYTSCGHEPALLCRMVDGKPHVIELPSSGPALAVMEEIPGEELFESIRIPMVSGDALLLYTDGLSDSGIDTAHMLGATGIEQQLMAFFQRSPLTTNSANEHVARDLIDYCIAETGRFAAGIVRDDICLLAVVLDTVPVARVFTDYDAFVPIVPPLPDAAAQTAADYVALTARQDAAESLQDALILATGGKLRYCLDKSELPAPLSLGGDVIDLPEGDNVRTLRRQTRLLSEQVEIPEIRTDALEMAAGEAANNGLIHGANAVAFVSADPQGTVQVRVEDNGPGISPEILPLATLEPGFTTSGTPGQGFWIMLNSVDRCWLLTTPVGTTVVLEQDRASTGSYSAPPPLLQGY